MSVPPQDKPDLTTGGNVPPISQEQQPDPFPPDARPLTRKPKRRIWPLLLVIIAVVAVILIVAAVFGPKSSDQPVNGGGASTSGDASGDVAMGQVTKEGQLTFSVNSVKLTSAPIGGQKPHGQWELVRVHITNVGDSPQTFYTASQEGWAHNKRYSPDDTQTAMLPLVAASGIWYEDIQPGNDVTGTLVFDLPKGKRLDRLVLHENPGSEGVGVKL